MLMKKVQVKTRDKKTFTLEESFINEVSFLNDMVTDCLNEDQIVSLSNVDSNSLEIALFLHEHYSNQEKIQDYFLSIKDVELLQAIETFNFLGAEKMYKLSLKRLVDIISESSQEKVTFLLTQ